MCAVEHTFQVLNMDRTVLLSVPSRSSFHGILCNQSRDFLCEMSDSEDELFITHNLHPIRED